MLDLIEYHDGNVQSLPPIVRGMVYNIISRFMRDKMLRRIEDEEGLMNIARMKFYESIRKFKYETDLDEDANQRRFISMFKLSVTRAFIDQQYTQNLPIRRPANGIISIEDVVPACLEGEEIHYEPEDLRERCMPLNEAMKNDLQSRIRSGLDQQSIEVFDMLLMGYRPEEVSRKTGINISKVRHMIYNKIRPVVSQYAESNCPL